MMNEKVIFWDFKSCEIQVCWDVNPNGLGNKRVWVNSNEGDCIARWDKRAGMDIHHPARHQVEEGEVCLACSPNASFGDFCRELWLYYQIPLPHELLADIRQPEFDPTEVAVVWSQIHTGTMWSIPYGLRPYQSPRDLFEAGNTSQWRHLAGPEGEAFTRALAKIAHCPLWYGEWTYVWDLSRREPDVYARLMDATRRSP